MFSKVASTPKSSAYLPSSIIDSFAKLVTSFLKYLFGKKEVSPGWTTTHSASILFAKSIDDLIWSTEFILLLSCTLAILTSINGAWMEYFKL